MVEKQNRTRGAARSDLPNFLPLAVEAEREEEKGREQEGENYSENRRREEKKSLSLLGGRVDGASGGKSGKLLSPPTASRDSWRRDRERRPPAERSCGCSLHVRRDRCGCRTTTSTGDRSLPVRPESFDSSIGEGEEGGKDRRIAAQFAKR